MADLIAVITPSKPDRSAMLAECIASVKAQTKPAVFHSVEVDVNKVGPSKLRNKMVSELPKDVEWIAFLDDDDLFLPNHLELLSSVSANADVVYSSCQPGIATIIKPFNREALKHFNYIAVTSLVRRSMFDKVGGFADVKLFEDWLLWKSIANEGGRFVFVPKQTWVYKYKMTAVMQESKMKNLR